MDARHAQAVMQVMAAYARQGKSISMAALAGAAQFVEWQHYPQSDAIDLKHRTEFYYHAHSASERPADEHGHFHVFARTQAGRRFHHLIGISMNAVGMPSRLFLTNQWVTGEDWLSAQSIAPLVDRFECQQRGRLAPIGRWITGMLHLYRDEIHRLHAQRDRWLDRRSRRRPADDVLSDRTHHVVAQKPIDILRHLSRLS